MDPNSGKIYDLEKIGMTPDEAKRKGLVPIPKTQEPHVQQMNRHDRRAWAARQRKAKP